MESNWGHFEHGADVGVRGLGAGKAGAFEQAALALVALVSDPAGVRPLQAVPVVCNTPDDELLLLDWLNAVVSEVAVRRMLFSAFTVTMSDGRLDWMRWPPESRSHPMPCATTSSPSSA
jgi:SHS2 domain-containing protein